MARGSPIRSGGSTPGRSSGSARSRRWSSGTRTCPSSPCCSTRPPRPATCWRRRDAEDAEPLDPTRLRGLSPDGAARLALRLHPSASFLESRWPVDRVWRANQPGADPDAVVDLDAGGVRLEVRRLGDDVVFRSLAAATYAFRSALAAGGNLERAVEAAQAAGPEFDLTQTLRELLDDGLVVGSSAPRSRMGAG